MTRSIFFLIPLLIVSCAVEPVAKTKDSLNSEVVAQQTVAPEENLDRVVCRKEKKTGSHRPTKICRTVRKIQEDKIRASSTMDKIRTLPSQ
ncbi:MAG: hypothetical protein ACI92E_001420 [Oceanicoccus sp.]|jgi:hypothetical protein